MFMKSLSQEPYFFSTCFPSFENLCSFFVWSVPPSTPPHFFSFLIWRVTDLSLRRLKEILSARAQVCKYERQSNGRECCTVMGMMHHYFQSFEEKESTLSALICVCSCRNSIRSGEPEWNTLSYISQRAMKSHLLPPPFEPSYAR